MELTPESPATNGVFPFTVKAICASNKQVFFEIMLRVKRTNSFLLVNDCSHKNDCAYIYWLQ